MMMAVEVPAELFDIHPLGVVATADGEALAGVADCPAGPWLGAVLDSIDVSKLSRWDLPTYIAACAKQQAWAASMLDTAIAEFASRPPDLNIAVDVEVSHALREPIGVAQRRIARALRLRRSLPAFKAAFRRGEISEYDADQLVRATDGCDDPDTLAEVQDKALANRDAKTAKELRRYARKVIDRLDPTAASRRARKARTEADVTLHPGEDGTAAVVVDQPIEDAMTVKAAADAYAIQAKQAGDPRRIGVLRAEGLTRLCSDYLTGQSTLPAAAPRSGGRPIEIGIVIGLRTALGIDDLPGEVPAAGIVPREAIGELIAKELPRLRLMVVDDDPARPGYGRLVYRGVESYRPTVEQVAHVRAAFPTSLGLGSNVRAERCDVDHFVEWPLGDTIVTNLGPLDRTTHNHKTRRSLRVTVDDSGTVIVTTVLGQTRTVTPYDYSAHLEPRPEATDEVADDEPPPF